MTSEFIFQTNESHIGTECHLSNTIGVEIELVFNYIREMLKEINNKSTKEINNKTQTHAQPQ